MRITERSRQLSKMFHKAIDLQFCKGTCLRVMFQDGCIKEYDMSSLFEKYPSLRALEDRELFLSGRLMGYYGIVWNDKLDIEVESIYEHGKLIKKGKPAPNVEIGRMIAEARSQCNISQKELAVASGIDQSDISKIERGISNPTIGTLKRLADAMGMKVEVSLHQ